MRINDKLITGTSITDTSNKTKVTPQEVKNNIETIQELKKNIEILEELKKYKKQNILLKGFVEILDEMLLKRQNEDSNITREKLILEYIINTLNDILKK